MALGNGFCSECLRRLVQLAHRDVGVAPDKALQSLRASLNPLTKFDFGVLRVLPNAKDWQAR